MNSSKPSLMNNRALINAYCDLIFLLDRNYPKKSALTFVSNHYTLKKKYRNILNRVTFSSDTVQIIQSNLVRNYDLIKGKDFHIDTYNQIITMFSLMNHDPLIKCRDGVLRDIFSSLHGIKDLRVNRELLSAYINALVKLEPKKVFFYFDKQISHSSDHAKLTSALFHEFGLIGSCVVHKAVDWSLRNRKEEIVISHDSAILTVVPQCFDFFSWYLNKFFPSSLSHHFLLNFQKIICLN